MKTCGTCMHWTPKEDYTLLLRVEYREGESWEDQNAREIARNAGYGDCGAVVFYADVAEEDDRPLFIAYDGSGYKAGVSTLAEFGCTLWHAKPGEEPKMSRATCTICGESVERATVGELIEWDRAHVGPAPEPLP